RSSGCRFPARVEPPSPAVSHRPGPVTSHPAALLLWRSDGAGAPSRTGSTTAPAEAAGSGDRGGTWQLEACMATAADQSAPPRPTDLVRVAVEALHHRFFEPLDVATLLRDAWDGAAAALARAGVSPLPPAPTYPADPAAADARHA